MPNQNDLENMNIDDFNLDDIEIEEDLEDSMQDPQDNQDEQDEQDDSIIIIDEDDSEAEDEEYKENNDDNDTKSNNSDGDLFDFNIEESELGFDDSDNEESSDSSPIRFDEPDENTKEEPEYNANSSIDDLDAEIARLSQELGNIDTSPDNQVDDDGVILDSNSLLEDDGYEVAPRDADFLSPTGEIVVMDPSDSEDNFKLIYVDIENIAIVKRIRASNNVEDLVKSIKSTGLLKPVDVAPTSVDGVYVLLDGYRRILACARAGKRRIPCVVNTKVSVPEIPILEAMYNHSKKYSIKEMIDYIDYLEKQKGIMSASMIEYLLQMNSGDYTKLKDILNDNDDDIVSKLMDGLYTIEAAFKKLEQRRKKESAEEKDLKKATKVYEDDPESGASTIAESGETSEGAELTDEEIKSLAINASELSDAEDKDLDELINEGKDVPGFKPHKQDPKYRERLDPAQRKAVLARDNNTCQICEQISGMEFTEVLDVHHIQEVYLGGNDDINNLITACTVCHKLVHLYGRGQLNIRPTEEMSEIEQNRFKKIVTLGNIIRKGMALRGMKLEQLKKLDNADTIGRTKPGTGQEAG